MKTKKGKNFPEIISYLIPTVGVIIFCIYNVLALFIDELECIQNSVGFDNMLETIVTFISIVLSVFGFLIPAFLSSKGSSLLIQYFLDNIDVRTFVAKLKNVVAIGLIDILLTCMLLLNDIFSATFMNVSLGIWLWFILYFMCVSYRFISILLSVMVGGKGEKRKEVINEAPKETTDNLQNSIRKI